MDTKYDKDSRMSYMVVPAWVAQELKLGSNELLIYSLIYGFNKAGKKFNGTANYVAKCIGTTRRTVMRVLKDLTDSGMLIKDTKVEDFGTVCEYSINIDYEIDGEKVVKKYQKLEKNELNNPKENDVCEDNTPPCDKMTHPCDKMTHPVCKNDTQYNNIYYNTSYSNTSYYHTSYDNTRNNYTQGPEPSAQATSELKKHITKNSKTHKWVNRVVGYIQTKQIDKEVYALLIDFIKNLVEMDTRLPFVSIQQQVDALLELSIEKQKQALNETIINGWKSLKFSIDKINGAAAETPKYRNGRDFNGKNNKKNNKRDIKNGGDKSKTMTDDEKVKLRERMLSSNKQEWY